MKRRLICFLMALSVIVSLFAAVPASAASAMKASDSCLDFIKAFEGFSGTPYLDADGLYTIGYGTRCPTELVEQYKKTPMTTAEAMEELRKFVATYEKAVNSFIDRHKITMTQQQFDAVISLIFNVGEAWLTKGDTLIKALNSGATGNDLIYAFTIYSLVNGSRSIPHVQRRLAEANIYLYGQYSRTLPDNMAYVIYNANAKDGKVSSYNVQGYNTDLKATPAVTATREGYKFKGWYTASSGGKLVTALDATTKNKTLYAQWEADSAQVLDDAPAPETITVKVTGTGVNVRSGPGLSYGKVTSVTTGMVLTITDVKQADGYVWGKYDKGWLALKYTNYDGIPPCHHTYTTTDQQAPTCTQSGTVIYTCSGCGHSYKQIKTATEHSYKSVVTKPAQGAYGYTTYTCTKCNDCYVDNYTFLDVTKGAWYYTAVNFAVKNGYFSGYKNGNFGPNDEITRQDFAVVLARIEGVDLSKYSGRTSFKDVPAGSYYEAAIKWANSEGIIRGYTLTEFGVGDKLTREQLVTILYRFAEYKKCDTAVTSASKNRLNSFADGKSISDFARTSCAWALQNKVINGLNATTFGPQKYANRAQVATILMNICNSEVIPF